MHARNNAPQTQASKQAGPEGAEPYTLEGLHEGHSAGDSPCAIEATVTTVCSTSHRLGGHLHKAFVCYHCQKSFGHSDGSLCPTSMHLATAFRYIDMWKQSAKSSQENPCTPNVLADWKDSCSRPYPEQWWTQGRRIGRLGCKGSCNIQWAQRR